MESLEAYFRPTEATLLTASIFSACGSTYAIYLPSQDLGHDQKDQIGPPS